MDAAAVNLRILLQESGAYGRGLAHTYIYNAEPRDLPRETIEPYLSLAGKLGAGEIGWESFMTKGVTYITDDVLRRLKRNMMARGIADRDGDPEERAIASANG
jgi:hypothetical protein